MKPIIHQITDGECIYVPKFYGTDFADRYFSNFIEGITWTQEKMNRFDREIKFPRCMAFYGDTGKTYSFLKTPFILVIGLPHLLKLKPI
ncbi:MAG: hypothetical protein P8I82_02845 [Flavobacteriales bacterium]|nr:hypothetical protein [Flavobacteriales bacterium]